MTERVYHEALRQPWELSQASVLIVQSEDGKRTTPSLIMEQAGSWRVLETLGGQATGTSNQTQIPPRIPGTASSDDTRKF
jgi:hypothetical protein